MVIKVNDRVMAKWPGSTLWFEGVVIDLNDIEYLVRFNDDGNSEYVLKYRDVKLFNAFQRRSRSRSRGRSKSKTRQTRLPVNEVETKVETKENEVKRESTPKIEPEPKRENSQQPKPSPEPARPSSPAKVTKRQSMRIAALAEKNEVDGEAPQVNNVNASKKVDSKMVEEEDTPAPAQGLGARLCGGVTCIGSCLKAGLLMVIPSFATVGYTLAILVSLLMPLFLNRMCTKKKCTVLELPDIPPKLELYYDLKAVGMTAVFLVLLMLLSLIPLGRKVSLPNGSVLRVNGYISLVVSLALVPALMYFEVNVLIVYKLYQQLLSTMTVLTVVLTLLLHIKARNIPDDAKNPAGSTGVLMKDLYNGREMSPVLGVDLKFFFYRAMALAVLLFNVIFVIKDLDANKGQYSPTLLVASTLQIFSAVDMLWFEESFTVCYEYQRMACGFKALHLYLLGPFFLSIYSRIVLNHRTELEWYFLSLIAAVHLLGYTLSRGSYSQMHAFQKNPSDPALAHLESLPTSAGTRLLVSGWWGVVRHPNYLGTIICFSSWSLLCGFSLALPWILLALSIITYVTRIYEVENDSRRKYGTAWDSYTQRVKYRLIPKVF